MRKIVRNKRGVEIAVNYIVMLVLGLATLALGFVIIKSFVSGGDQTITLTSEQLNSKVADLLCDPTDIICFSDNNQRIHRSEYAFVGLHVKNILNQPITVKVTVDPAQTKFYPADSSQSYNPADTNIVGGSDSLDIGPKATSKVGFGIYASKTANKGTYSYLVTVEDASGTSTFATRKDRIIVEVI